MSIMLLLTTLRQMDCFCCDLMNRWAIMREERERGLVTWSVNKVDGNTVRMSLCVGAHVHKRPSVVKFQLKCCGHCSASHLVCWFCNPIYSVHPSTLRDPWENVLGGANNTLYIIQRQRKKTLRYNTLATFS